MNLKAKQKIRPIIFIFKHGVSCVFFSILKLESSMLTIKLCSAIIELEVPLEHEIELN